MEEEDKHDKPKAYTYFNTRFWIAEDSTLLKTLKKRDFMLHLIYMTNHWDNTILDSTERRANESN